MFAGAFTAIVTPFRDGRVDEKALRQLVRLGIDGGVSGFVPCGTTGESPTLSHEEHNKILDVLLIDFMDLSLLKDQVCKCDRW